MRVNRSYCAGGQYSLFLPINTTKRTSTYLLFAMISLLESYNKQQRYQCQSNAHDVYLCMQVLHLAPELRHDYLCMRKVNLYITRF